MARKRMILEEMPEPNPLVPGSPDNPIKLGEKAKHILVHMKLYEDAGRVGDPNRYYDADYTQAMERLEFLKLIEFLPKLDDAAILAKRNRIDEIRHAIAVTVESVTSKQLMDYATDIHNLEQAITNNTTVAKLTDAGRALLITGNISVSV